jgi:hypothetical protein
MWRLTARERMFALFACDARTGRRLEVQILGNQVSRVVASPRTFNLVVSNIPGPAEPMYMLGCELEALPDAGSLAVDIDSALNELLERASPELMPS